MTFDTVKGIVRGDYMTGCLTTVIGAVTGLDKNAIINSKEDIAVKARIALCALRIIINTTLTFIILAPLAVIAKPLLAIAGVAALVVFVASVILNHDWFKQPNSFLAGINKAAEKVDNAVDNVVGAANQLFAKDK